MRWRGSISRACEKCFATCVANSSAAQNSSCVGWKKCYRQHPVWLRIPSVDGKIFNYRKHPVLWQNPKQRPMASTAEMLKNLQSKRSIPSVKPACLEDQLVSGYVSANLPVRYETKEQQNKKIYKNIF